HVISRHELTPFAVRMLRPPPKHLSSYWGHSVAMYRLIAAAIGDCSWIALRRQQISLENRMLDTNVIVVVASTFLLAGMVKGVIGLGLPAVTLGVLTVAFDLPSAMSLLLVPSFVTNLWQASVG